MKYTTAEMKDYFLHKRHLEKGGCNMFLQVRMKDKKFWVPYHTFTTRTVSNILIVFN